MGKNHDVYVVIQEELTREEALAGKAARMIWYSVDHFDTLGDAQEHVDEMSETHEHQTGFGFSKLDQ